MSNDFNLIMLSAWHEMGGNTLQRHLDSHPELMVYPFESTMATQLSTNFIAGPNHWVPQRYAYPEFSTAWKSIDAYHHMVDHELKPYLRSRETSKFKDCGLKMDENTRCFFFRIYSESGVAADEAPMSDRVIGIYPPNRSDYIEAYFRSAFKAWGNFNFTGKERVYVGYIPPILMDAEKFFADFPNGKMIHIVRNPWSGYADTIKRPYPFSLSRYAQIWNVTSNYARVCERKWPKNFFTVRYEDLIADPKGILNELCGSLGLQPFTETPRPSFNRKPLEQVYPWGTIKSATTEANIATARELTAEQAEKIWVECRETIIDWNYTGFLDLIK